MYKIGTSMDIHRLVDGDGIVLGGIKVPCNKKALAHSDGDVILHAITEAILGALGKGDLGDNFPDSDPKYKGMDSTYFINVAKGYLKEEGYHINNVDVMIQLEAPKIGPYKEQIRANVAKLLELDIKCVSIKAGTMEKVGPIGQNEATLAMCSLIIEKS